MTKPFWKSKINWVAFITFLAGFLVDPKLLDWLDPYWANKIMMGASTVTFILRTWFTKVDVA